MTIPLLVDRDGNKFGKSTGGGALWLDADKTSPYSLYQYLLNVQDTEVEDLLYRLTFQETI
jgi:tyrosyl-tRNA synthetase